ncbi:hypothetical protein CYLTODRAFT_441950 [Cylindrobasidium torrendii FP15055 ss-10]|uniref:Uncharacterized protein n=1 Tax=Cylindrobasidium torrendii FP15055 ss-10 TaxID=1314674 RepID=A0A0D7BLL9_9AGAR|nr:hypothetical protein CYLTODRAFT_441950 [Cylindrobasidium torrendii FP15055 ss-10]
MGGDPWQHAEIMAWIGEVSKPAIQKIYWGPKHGENTSKDPNRIAHDMVARKIIPERYTQDKTKAIKRVAALKTSMEKTFKKHSLRLTGTGGGVEDDVLYVRPEGPDNKSDPRAQNIWNEIIKDWPYFKDLWKIWSTKPNLIPICYSTGIGPGGPQTVMVQRDPPSTPTGSVARTPSDENINPSLRDHGPHIPGSAAAASAAFRHRDTLSNENAAIQPADMPPTIDTNADDLTVASPLVPSAVPKVTHAKPSSFSALKAVDGSPIVPHKRRTVEDDLLAIQKDMVITYGKRLDDKSKREEKRYSAKKQKREARTSIANHRQYLDERKTLIEEFKLGIMDQAEYRSELESLKVRFGYGPAPVQREASPEWDEEAMDKDFSS